MTNPLSPLRPSLRARRLRRDEQGMATSEFAVGTVGACGIAGVLLTLAENGVFDGLLGQIFEQITSWLPF